VSWNDAQAFVRWLREKTARSFRLPSEAEWEYAARAGSVGTLYGFGNEPSDLCRYGNVADQSSSPSGRTLMNKAECNDGFFFTAPVANYKANVWGLYDMHGNVWEWAEDCYNASYAGAPAEGRAWSTGGCERRVNRGGGWSNNPAWVRSASRFRYTPTLRFSTLGFRLAEDRP
jgi:formylglycine-generating enzyme required for sulfatase activity